MSPPTDPEPLNLARERFEYSLDNLLRIDTKMKRVASTEEKDVDQVIDSPLSELDDEEMAALSIAAIHVPRTDNSKRLDKAKTSNLTAPRPTVPTSENTHTRPRRSQRAAAQTATARIKKGTKAQFHREEADAK